VGELIDAVAALLRQFVGLSSYMVTLVYFFLVFWNCEISFLSLLIFGFFFVKRGAD
jgi:uncharacterized membrane protein